MKAEAGTGKAMVCLPASFAEFYDRAAPDVYRYLARAAAPKRSRCHG
jgi:hypothetical protein